jgi:hypothetical protein
MKFKQFITFSIIFVMSKLVFSQLIFDNPKIITDSASGVQSVFVTDLNGDDLQDVIYITRSATLDDEVGWLKNKDSTYVYSGLLNNNIMEGRAVYACDIDGDNDNDVISGSYGKIAWYENMDDAGSFGTEQIIHSSGKIYSIYACDVDNDGDNDIIAAIFTDDEIVWFENTDGAGNFSTKNVINDTAYGASCVFASDIDSDGDTDVLSALAGHDQIEWYENTDSAGTFGPPHIISSSLIGVLAIHSADVDGDGDQDVISGSASVTSGGDSLFWYENDGQGTFDSVHIVSAEVDIVKSIDAHDMDNDGDIDILSASSGDEKIVYYENLGGTGMFVNQTIINDDVFGASAVFAADINNDGETDVVSASSGDNKIVWYKNLGLIPFNINISKEIPFKIYPVPVVNELNLKHDFNTILSMQIIDISGKCIQRFTDVQGKRTIDFSDFTSGIYFLQIQTDNSTYTVKVIKK